MSDHSGYAAVRARAYELWETNGRTEGQHEEHWHQAEREIVGAKQSHGGDAASQDADRVSKLPEQDGEPEILHRVPEPAPGR